MTHDQATGRRYARNGLRVGRSCHAPAPEDRYSSWAARYFRQPAHMRSVPTRIRLNEPALDALVASVAKR